MSTLRLPKQAQWRYWVQHPGQFLLTLLILAVGVASAVGMDIAIEASQKSFVLSLAATNGRATHRIEANGGIPEQFLERLRVAHHFREATPVVTGQLRLKRKDGNGTDVNEGLRLLGLDPLIDNIHLSDDLSSVEAPRNQGAITSPVEALMQPGAVAMSNGLARRLGVKEGDTMECVGGQQVRLASLFESGQGGSLDSFLLCDIATAQELLGQRGKLSYIALKAPDGEAGKSWEERLRATLPAGYQLTTVGQRSYASLQLASSLFLNLKALSWMAALVGVFLIYQAHSFCLLANRPQLAQLRRLGLTPQESAWIVLQDGLWLGWLGSLLGCLGGIALSRFLIKMLSATLEDLYFSLQVQSLSVSHWSILRGLAVGLATAALAVLPHALSIYREPPLLLGMNSRLEADTNRMLKRFFALGVLLCLAGVAGLSLRLSLPGHLWALLGLVMGTAAMIPFAVGEFNKLLTRGLRPLVPLWFSLGLRQVQANMSRTGVAVAALSMALASIVSIETMVSSFRGTLDEWLEQTLQADIYMVLADRDSMREGAFVPDKFFEALRAQGLSLDEQGSGQGTGDWAGVEGMVIRHAVVTFAGLSQDIATRHVLVALPGTETQLASYRLAAASADPKGDFRRGKAWVSQPFSRHNHIQVGDRLLLPTPAGRQEIVVAGVFVDFSSDQGYVLVSYQAFRHWFADDHVTGLALLTRNRQEIPQIIERVRRLPGADLLEIRSNAALKALSKTIFERTFQVTKAVRWFALTIALVGMTSSLTVLALQKRKERALMRALGMTHQEVTRIHFIHSLLLGFWSGLFAIGAGLAQAYAMVKVVQSTAFGWTLAFSIPTSAWTAPWAAALCCCLAALLSVGRERQSEIIALLREE